ncbi:hypothetical protein V8C44DRAFT_306990 [Trichoderma aethiopicum]
MLIGPNHWLGGMLVRFKRQLMPCLTLFFSLFFFLRSTCARKKIYVDVNRRSLIDAIVSAWPTPLKPRQRRIAKNHCMFQRGQGCYSTSIEGRVSENCHNHRSVQAMLRDTSTR